MKTALALLLALAPLHAGEIGRYRIVPGEVFLLGPSSTGAIKSSLLLDTATGQTWRLQATEKHGTQWIPIPPAHTNWTFPELPATNTTMTYKLP